MVITKVRDCWHGRVISLRLKTRVKPEILLDPKSSKITARGVAIFAKAFMSIPAQQAAKTTRPLMPAAAPAVLVTRSLPNKG